MISLCEYCFNHVHLIHIVFKQPFEFVQLLRNWWRSFTFKRHAHYLLEEWPFILGIIFWNTWTIIGNSNYSFNWNSLSCSKMKKSWRNSIHKAIHIALSRILNPNNLLGIHQHHLKGNSRHFSVCNSFWLNAFQSLARICYSARFLANSAMVKTL